MVICAEGLSGIKEAIQAAFKETEYQRCIVHQVRNTLKYVSYKDMKSFATELKSIYLAPNGAQGLDNLERVKKKWDSKYPNAMKSWERNWDVLTPIFKFSVDVRKVIYTTNALKEAIANDDLDCTVIPVESHGGSGEGDNTVGAIMVLDEIGRAHV